MLYKFDCGTITGLGDTLKHVKASRRIIRIDITLWGCIPTINVLSQHNTTYVATQLHNLYIPLYKETYNGAITCTYI